MTGQPGASGCVFSSLQTEFKLLSEMTGTFIGGDYLRGSAPSLRIAKNLAPPRGVLVRSDPPTIPYNDLSRDARTLVLCIIVYSVY